MAAAVAFCFVRGEERMTDDELVQAFESATLAGDAFPHEAHVRVAWYYLTRHPMLTALTRFRSALQRFAAGS